MARGCHAEEGRDEKVVVVHVATSQGFNSGMVVPDNQGSSEYAQHRERSCPLRSIDGLRGMPHREQEGKGGCCYGGAFEKCAVSC
jgi:hypothetical protein